MPFRPGTQARARPEEVCRPAVPEIPECGVGALDVNEAGRRIGADHLQELGETHTAKVADYIPTFHANVPRILTKLRQSGSDHCPCQRDAILVTLRCLRRSQRRGSEIHAESFAPYGHCAVFGQIQVATERVVLVADVALDDSQIDETSPLHRRYIPCIVRGNHVDVHIRTV
jgi:hypothetical protein